MAFSLSTIFKNLFKSSPEKELFRQLSTLIQGGTGQQITDFLSNQPDEIHQSLYRSGTEFIKQAIERGDVDILDAVMAGCADNKFGTIIHTSVQSQMGSVSTGSYDVLGYSMVFGTEEMTKHILGKPTVFPSMRHLTYAQKKGETELIEAFVQKGVRVELAGEDFKLVRT